MHFCDDRFARLFGVCHYSPPDGGDDDGDDADKGGSGGGGDAGGGDKTDWKAEAEKWKGLARKHETEAKKNADAAKKLADLENANKSEIEKSQAAREAADKDAATARTELSRMRVALKKGLTESQAKRLVGTTEEELEADADELLTTFKPPENNNGNERSRPRESLRPGTAPNQPPPVDVKKIVDEMVEASR